MTSRKRRKSPPDNLEQQAAERGEEAAPAEPDPQLKAGVFVTPRWMKAERQALCILPVVAWLAGSSLADKFMNPSKSGVSDGQSSPPAFWLLFISFGLVALGFAAIYAKFPGFKRTVSSVLLLSAAVLLLAPVFLGETLFSYYATTPGGQHSAYGAAIATAMYCVWAASFLDREARLMRK